MTVSIIPSSCVISYFNPTSDSKFRWLIWYIAIKFFFDILLLYYYSIVLTVRLSIILCLSSGNIYFSLGIILSFSSVTVSELLYFEFFETFAILLLMKLPVASGVFHVLLLYNLNLSSAVTSCLYSRDIYFSLGISLSYSIVTFSEWFCFEFFENFLTLSAILLPLKSPVASAVFWIVFLEKF